MVRKDSAVAGKVLVSRMMNMITIRGKNIYEKELKKEDNLGETEQEQGKEKEEQKQEEEEHSYSGRGSAYTTSRLCGSKSWV